MQANSNNETCEQSSSSEIPPGAGGEAELPADIESKNKVIEKIVPLRSNLEMHFDGVQTRKRRRAGINIHAGCLQAGEVVPINGNKIIESSILQGVCCLKMSKLWSR